MITLDDIKIPDSVKEAAKEKKLHEIISFIYAEFGKNKEWDNLDQYSQSVLVEQCFVINFTNFPAKIQLAAALALLEEDETYNKLESYTDKNALRSLIKRAGTSITVDDKGEFVYNEDVINSLKEFYKQVPNDKIVNTLLGEEGTKKLQQ